MKKSLSGNRIKRALLIICLIALLVMPTQVFAAGGSGTVTVRIDYADQESGVAVAPSYKAVLAPGDAYSAESPDVDGYTLVDAADATISGKASEDFRKTVYYRSGTAEYLVHHHFCNNAGVELSVETETRTAARNTTIDVDPLERTGYRCVTDDRRLSIPTQGTVEIDLYYVREQDNITIHFVTGGGTAVSPITAPAGTDISAEKSDRLAASPTRAGYEFDGWDTEIPDTMPDESMTIHARWKAGTAKYRVVEWFKTNPVAENNYQSGSVTVLEGTSFEKATYEKHDYSDQGYEFEKADEDAVIQPDGSTVVNVYYQPYEVAVTYYLDVDETKIYSTETLRVGEHMNTPDEKAFLDAYHDQIAPETDRDKLSLRWRFYSKSRGEYLLMADVPPVMSIRRIDTENRTMKVTPRVTEDAIYQYYAWYYQLNPNTNQYEKTYQTSRVSPYGLGYEGSGTAFTYYPGGFSGYKLVKFQTNHGLYDGTDADALQWNEGYSITGDDNGRQAYRINTTPSNVIAFFYDPLDYPLQYYDGSTLLREESYKTGTNVRLTYEPATSDNHPGYVFAGWYLQGDETETVIDELSIQPVYNIVVAKWTKPSYKVTFDSDGGTPVDAQTVQQGESAVRPDDPVKDGYKFSGWYLKDNDMEAYEFDLPVTKDIELVARYIPVTTKTSYDVIHRLADGTVLKQEHFDGKTSGTCVTAHSLTAAEFPQLKETVPDAFIKSLRLSADGENTIVFTYSPFPKYTYSIDFLDKNNGKSLLPTETITDIARIMTVRAKDIEGYVSENKYGRGTSDSSHISLYYNARKNQNNNPEKPDSTDNPKNRNQAGIREMSGGVTPVTGDSSHAVLWIVLMLAAAGAAFVVIRTRKTADK